MEALLKEFYDNELMREAVLNFFLLHLQGIAIERSFRGESTVGIKEGNEILANGFAELKKKFGKVDKPNKPRTSR